MLILVTKPEPEAMRHDSLSWPPCASSHKDNVKLPKLKMMTGETFPQPHGCEWALPDSETVALCGPHFLLTHQTGLPASEERRAGPAAPGRAESSQARLADRRRMVWVAASQTEDAGPDGDTPVNLDGAVVGVGSLVLLS